MRKLLAIFAILGTTNGVHAETRVSVAVATNFLPVLEELALVFEQQARGDVVITSGATGKLYAQISQGAPFDVFLSADSAAPTRLAAEGNGVAETQFTYAFGRLALHAKDPALLADGDLKAALSGEAVRHIALAQPDVAPYGRAAMEVLTEFALDETLAPKLAFGQNVGQAFALVDSGAADLGFVALSSAIGLDPETVIVVPEGMHAPIRQDAILTKAGAGNAAAADFLTFLKSRDARAIILRYGYDSGGA